MDWSSAEYSFICYGSDKSSIFTEESGSDRFDSTRVFEFTNEKLKAKYQEDLSRLSDLPAIVVAETYQHNAPRANFSRIRITSTTGRYITFDFEHLHDFFSSREVFDSNLFATSDMENARVHWAIKEGNLPEKFLQFLKRQKQMDKPKMFSVEEWPLPNLGHVAVMMPFSSVFDPVYEAIKAACKDEGLSALRVDEIYRPNIIMNDVFRTIIQSTVVVCDLTGRNPNVLYETGLAHARNCEVIILTQREDDIPFDLGHIRHISYLPNGEGLAKLREDLRRFFVIEYWKPSEKHQESQITPSRYSIDGSS